jgi:lipoprotein-anchoring transpeptidase ErfK/SrfK
MARRLLAALICATLTVGVIACGRVDEVPPPPAVLVAPVAAEPALPLLSALHTPWAYKSQERKLPEIFTAADTIGTSIAIYDAPGAPAPSRTLSNPTREGVPLVFLVRGQQPDWVQVQVPIRPNGLTGWVHAADVSLRLIPNHIVVELNNRRVTAYDPDDNVLFQAAVGIGQDRYPTPVGDFFVDSHFANPGGAYGVYMLSVAGFSDVLETFGGGVGQIAMHGTNRPDLIGGKVSHGCVRMTNESITQLKDLAPPGTPVEIVP